MDLSEIIKKQKNGSEGVFCKPLASIHEFYINGTIKESEEYVDIFDTIRHAGENDIIKIYINSYGGDLFTAIQFMRVLGDTNATTIASVEGACMSAATMIFMCCDNFEVTPHSMFMFHNYSGGTIGKGGEMIDQLIHERRWSERLLNEVYKDFLSEEEIKAMLDNKDIWMDGEEVVKRIEYKIAKAIEQLENAQDEEEEEALEEAAPVKAKPRKTAKKPVKTQ